MNTQVDHLIPPDIQPREVVPINTLIELRKKGLSYEQIGKIVNRSMQTVWERLQPYQDAIDGLQPFKEGRADLLAIHQSRLLNSLSEGDINKMSGLQKITGAAVLYDKERLERGQSTANVAYQDQTRRLDELDKEIAALEAELGVVEDEGE